MDNIQEITLDIRDNHTYQQLYTKQYDYGSSIIFHITKNGKPFELEGARAVFSMKKPDNHVIENTIDVVDGTIAIDITEQMTSSYGKAKFSITLFKDDISITTITGIMKIDEAVIHPDDIESSDEYNIVVDILNKVVEAESAANTAIIKVEEASDFADAAKTSSTNAANSASTAIEKANEAAESASNAANSAIIATDKASDAYTSANNAAASADDAANSASLASTKATEASSSANTATIKATEASNSATNAQNYAIGDTDSSKYYYEQVKTISESLSGALRPIGTITFSNLPSLESALEGDMYNISDEFTTNENFKEGSGNVIPAGANVYKTTDGYWDVLAGTPVTSVNGQRGNVNITSESIGALATDGDSSENTVIYTSEDNLTANAWTDVAALTSNEKHSSIFNKVSKMFKNVRYIWKLLGTTDISAIGNGTITGAVSSLNGDLANKQPTITGAATTVTSSNLTANMVLRTNANGKIGVSQITANELNQLQGISSNIQTQLNDKITATGPQQVTGTKYFQADVLLDGSAYANAAIQMQSNSTDPHHAAGIGFHNLGNRGAYLFLAQGSNSLWVIYNNAEAYAINQTYSGTWSSKHVKENIKTMSANEAEKILDIDVVDFDYRNGEKNQHGIIAEDLYKILPNCVNMPENYNEDNVPIEKSIMNTPSIDYLKLIPYLIKMIQIQQNQIDDILNNLSN